MFQEAVMIPVGDWAKSRLSNLSEVDKTRDESKVGSGFGKNVANWVNRDKVYPTNVLHMATECNNKKHSATFPESLPEWFIKLFTEEEDWILDPFMGSGTTIKVAQRMRRNSIGIELDTNYYNEVIEQIQPKQYYLLDKRHCHPFVIVNLLSLSPVVKLDTVNSLSAKATLVPASTVPPASELKPTVSIADT